ncbi:type II secretion system protein GspM [Saccharospirillum salsuginis]|uniref:General secretion pathway protein M n=1 Tax=Saccharospirillum salsuginis TaxID=418750 RepID=A0A918K686_9GAMM|nr:type II secretion system protein GspM [Saccharospirillum salsuginis]GGX52045.1 hypothetical protein GCM10007392_19210 [Saccharospirillum salsuginis]
MFDLTSLFQPLIDRVNGLPQRDRRALIVLVISTALLLVWFALIQPVRQWQASANSELEAARDTYQELVAKAPEAMAGGAQNGGGDTASLNTELRRQANRFGLSIQSFEPDGDLLRVRIDEAQYGPVVQWLAALESAGVSTDQVTLEARSEPGLISVRASFQR